MEDTEKVHQKDVGAGRPSGRYGVPTRLLVMEVDMSAVMEGDKGMHVHGLLRVVQ